MLHLPGARECLDATPSRSVMVGGKRGKETLGKCCAMNVGCAGVCGIIRKVQET